MLHIIIGVAIGYVIAYFVHKPSSGTTPPPAPKA